MAWWPAFSQITSSLPPSLHDTCDTHPGRAWYLAAVPTVLHVDPVVLVVPETLNAQEVVILGAVAARRERVNEKALRHLTLS